MNDIKINRSPVILLFKILFLNVILDIIAIIILIIDYADMISNGHKGFSLEEYFFLIILLLQLFIIILIFMKWFYEYYIFKNNKLIYFKGIIFKKKQEFILDKIGCTDFEQSIFGKIFNYGDIIIYIQNENFKLRGISNPNGFIKLLGKSYEK